MLPLFRFFDAEKRIHSMQRLMTFKINSLSHLDFSDNIFTTETPVFRFTHFFSNHFNAKELAVLSITVQRKVRSFEDCAAGVWDGTGFVVSLENPKVRCPHLG